MKTEKKSSSRWLAKTTTTTATAQRKQKKKRVLQLGAAVTQQEPRIIDFRVHYTSIKDDNRRTTVIREGRNGQEQRLD